MADSEFRNTYALHWPSRLTLHQTLDCMIQVVQSGEKQVNFSETKASLAQCAPTVTRRTLYFTSQLAAISSENTAVRTVIERMYAPDESNIIP
jgi:hypothetical protein